MTLAEIVESVKAQNKYVSDNTHRQNLAWTFDYIMDCLDADLKMYVLSKLASVDDAVASRTPARPWTKPWGMHTTPGIMALVTSSGTSSASSRLVHGGLSYLEHGELGLVRESCLERALLLENAAGLVWPEQFVFPVRKGDRVGRLKLARELRQRRERASRRHRPVQSRRRRQLRSERPDAHQLRFARRRAGGVGIQQADPLTAPDQ